MAEISGGTFDLVEETVESLSAAELSPDRLGRLLAALKRFRMDIAVPPAEPRRAVSSEALLLVPALEGLPLAMQKVVAFFLETVVQLLLSGQSIDGSNRPPAADEVRDAAEHALQSQRMFPR
jgi:hypothetical protein